MADRYPLVLAAVAAILANSCADAHLVEDHWHVFSRSCPLGAGAQESITYAFLLRRWIYVISEHYQVDKAGARHLLHTVETTTDDPQHPGWHFGRRGRAGHFGEFWSGYVSGYHWGLKQYTGQKYLMWHSEAVDCNLEEW